MSAIPQSDVLLFILFFFSIAYMGSWSPFTCAHNKINSVVKT